MTTRLFKSKDHDEWKGCILAYGHFSTIHPGHIRYLRHAEKLGETLIVALVGDNSPSKYAFSQKERAEALNLLGIADGILLLDGQEIDKVIADINPKILVLGNEYKTNKDIKPTLLLQNKLGGKVQFHAGEINYSTTDFLGNTENELKEKRLTLFNEACKRQQIVLPDLFECIEAIKTTRLIVLGDTIIDQYAACEAIGMSAEAPVIVVRELERKDFVGGAAIVAAHISALGAQCDLISVVGEDENSQMVERALSERGIGNGVTKDASRPTTFKKRYLVENQKLFRVSRLEENNIDREVEDKVIEKLRNLAPSAKGIVVSDFVYGVVTPRILKEVQKLAIKYNLLLFGDLQCSSQVGSIAKFEDFTLLSPNEREARLALKDKDSGLEQLSQKLLRTTNAKYLIMKLGAEGFIAYMRNNHGEITSQPFPALSVNPLDVAGAGDSLLALYAACLSSGQSVMNTAALACCMTAIAVETMGNTPISSQTLRNGIQELLKK